MSQPFDRPCLHEREHRYEWDQLCTHCGKQMFHHEWLLWEEAMAAVRAHGGIPAIGVRFGDRIVPVSMDDAWPREGLIEEGKSYLLVALPAP